MISIPLDDILRRAEETPQCQHCRADVIFVLDDAGEWYLAPAHLDHCPARLDQTFSSTEGRS